MKPSILATFFILFSLFFSKESFASEWIFGTWRSEKLLIENGNDEKNSKENPPKQSCMVFDKDGRIFRISKSEGKQRIYGEFKVSGNILELSARNMDKFNKIGTYDGNEHLLLDFQNGRKLSLKKLGMNAKTKCLNLDKYLLVEIAK